MPPTRAGTRGVPGFLLLVALAAGQPASLARADLTPHADAPPARAPRGCTVEVRFSDVGVGNGFFHAYIVTRDPGRGPTHFRAGPSRPRRTRIAKAWALLRGVAAPDTWGAIRAEHGAYVPGSVDFEEGRPPTMTVLQSDRSCAPYNLRLYDAEIAVNAAQLPYNAATTNSNAFVPYALGWIHVVPGAPPVAAPGWYTTLDVR
jgi:hypothetical protein